MTKTVSLSLAGLLLAGLAACGGSTTEGEVSEKMDDFIEPSPPTIGASSVSTANALITELDGNGWRETPTGQILPSGTASYSGYAVADTLTVDGSSGVNGLFGEVDVEVDLLFAGDDVTGTISNIHTLNGSIPVERLGGQLAIEGSADDGNKLITTSISGDLSGTFGTGADQTVSVDGNMNGRFRDLKTTGLFGITTYDEASGAAGTFSGDISGGLTGSFSGDWAAEE